MATAASQNPRFNFEDDRLGLQTTHYFLARLYYNWVKAP
jgi:hypothetical protein